MKASTASAYPLRTRWLTAYPCPATSAVRSAPPSSLPVFEGFALDRRRRWMGRAERQRTGMVSREAVIESTPGRTRSPVRRLVVSRGQPLILASLVSRTRLFRVVGTNDGSEAFAEPGDVGGLVLCAAGRFDDDRGVRVADRADEQLLRNLAVPEVGVPVAMAVERVA